MNEGRIILALDNKNRDEIMDLVEKLKSVVYGFKFNDALDKEAKKVIGFVRENAPDCIIMADPKLHDIPNTVGNRAANFEEMGVNWLTVHASGGIKMMEKAVERAPTVRILGVTILTSLSNQDCNLTYGLPAMEKVIQFARWSKSAGCSGIVCSAKELLFLGKYDDEFDDLMKVVPGIRPKGYGQSDDQKRKMTPGEAIKTGADYLVIGRPITTADDPVEAAERINREIKEAL
ncbi:MAG: orotidine-5'-phosphate decarboxylase [Patescibacteria group bacterium]|nr:orotidine-5'-phosphate decarboxylase [Patescibacteria group bacterium]